MDLNGIISNFSIVSKNIEGLSSKHNSFQHSLTASTKLFRSTNSKTTIEDGKIIVEVYDKDGKLIKKNPPGYLPFDEVA